MGALPKLNIVQNPSESAVDERLLGTHLKTWRLLGRCPRQFGELDYAVPSLGSGEGDDRGGRLHLFVWPEGPADVVLFQHRDELCDPVVGVFAGFTEPDRNLVLLAEVDILLTVVWSGGA